MKLKIFILLFFFSNLIYPQDKDKSSTTIFDLFPKYISIAENSTEFNKIDVEARSPASFDITIPDSGKTSFLVNIAIRTGNILSVFNTNSQRSIFKLYVFSDWQRNTLLSKEQNIYKIGVQLHYTNIVNSFRELRTDLSIEANNSRNYKNNLWSWQINPTFSFAFDIDPKNNIFGYFLPSRNLIPVSKDNFEYQYIPSIGLEFSNVYAADLESQKGNIYAIVYKLNPTLYFLGKRILLSCDLQWRNNFENNTSNPLKTSNYQKISLNIEPFKEITKSIHFLWGIDYINGENPLFGFPKQHYWQIGFKLKI
jgi:hypothetical protein